MITKNTKIKINKLNTLYFNILKNEIILRSLFFTLYVRYR